MASCFIPALIQKLESVLESSGLIEGNLRSCSGQELQFVSVFKKLKSALTGISGVITDAEEKQLHQPNVKSWLEHLETALYEAEDVVDEINKIQLETGFQDILGVIFFYVSMIERERYMNRVVEAIDAAAKAKGELRLRAQNELGFSDQSYSTSSSSSSSVDDENAIYGREEDRCYIVQLLLSEDKNLDVIALVGKGGLGKTTLAQLVYNDEKVSKHFDLKVWIHVGCHWDDHIITRKILEAATFSSFEGYELQGKLSSILSGKKFLIVLDDVWIEDIRKRESLKSSLEFGARGSKIIVTTRRYRVADVMGCSTHYYHLNPLTMEDCWSIFENYAFDGTDKGKVETLEDIGRKIVDKCIGLPLLARAIGGLFRFKKTLAEWRQVLDELQNESFGSPPGDSISKLLWLTYYHLPAPLKGCYAYCSLFPKGYEFDKEELVLLWIAAGFLRQSTMKSMEMLGAKCFDSLLKRSFFITSDNSRYKLHHLMHDLAEFVSRDVCFRLESNASTLIPQRTRHLSLQTNAEILQTDSRLRSFYLFNSPSAHGSCQISPETLECFFARQQGLRVLSLPHFQHAELPASIGHMKYLRYLDVSDSTTLESLPESLCTLYCLQILTLTNCSSLLMLPEGMVNLVNLLKLKIKGTGLKQMPKEMSRLKSLQSLSNFIVGRGGSSIKELGKLQYLHGLLCISNLENLYPASDASAASLKDMEYLEELELEWSSNIEDAATGHKHVLQNLKPSVLLEKLSIRFYGGTEFPNWFSDSSCLNIKSLHLADCHNCEFLPPLGQLLFLEHLIVERFSSIKCIGHEFYGVDESKSFRSLKTLKFREMSHWEQWIPFEAEVGGFPCLQELYMINCLKLEGLLPKSLPSLKKLEISECHQQLAALLPLTPDDCVPKLDNCDKVQMRRDDVQKVAPLQVSPGLMQDDNKEEALSGEDGNQLFPSSSSNFSSMHIARNQPVAPEVSPSTMHPEQADNKKEALLGEDGHQQFLSSFSSMDIVQNQPVAPEVSPSSMHPEQADIKEKALSGEDGNQQFPSSSSDFPSMSNAQSMEQPTDNSLRIERFASNMLPKEILERSSLQDLYIIDCIHLKIFPLSPSLKTLYIHNCQSLEFPQPNKVKNQDLLLEDLCLGSSSDSLKIFPLSYFPKLRALSLWDCRNLESLSVEKELQTELTSLESLEIKDCPKLRSFIEEECQAPNLTSLVFFNCGSLKSLQWMQSFKSLHELYINNCPALESLPVEGLPTSLIILCISFCDKITPQKMWNLDQLHSLCHFEIEGGCMEFESFPEEGLLPMNLNSLRISRLSNLNSLDGNGLQSLTSLQTLEINCCEKLDSLPEHGMPSSLSSLSITDCSQLNLKLQSRKGKEWSKIAHVPSIHLDEVSD